MGPRGRCPPRAARTHIASLRGDLGANTRIMTGKPDESPPYDAQPGESGAHPVPLLQFRPRTLLDLVDLKPVDEVGVVRLRDLLPLTPPRETADGFPFDSGEARRGREPAGRVDGSWSRPHRLARPARDVSSPAMTVTHLAAWTCPGAARVSAARTPRSRLRTPTELGSLGEAWTTRLLARWEDPAVALTPAATVREHEMACISRFAGLGGIWPRHGASAQCCGLRASLIGPLAARAIVRSGGGAQPDEP